MKRKKQHAINRTQEILQLSACYDQPYLKVVTQLCFHFILEDAVLSQFSHTESDELNTSVSIHGSQVIESVPEQREYIVGISKSDIYNRNFDAHSEMVYDLASRQVKGMKESLYKELEQSGMAATTKDHTYEENVTQLLNLFRTVPMSFDKNGKPNLTLICSPDTCAFLETCREDERLANEIEAIIEARYLATQENHKGRPSKRADREAEHG